MYEISNIRKIFSLEGTHSAFTDIIKFEGYYYLGFMTGIKHMVHIENKSMVLKSRDGVNWIPSSIIYCGIDTREPKFMEIRGKLFAYFFTIDPAPDNSRMITNSWCVYTEDGKIWSKPIKIAYEEKFWRPACYDGVGYCVSHPKDPAPNKPCKLYKSRNGIDWDYISDIPIDPMKKPNEASLAFNERGDIYIFIRTDIGNKHSYVLKSEKPYIKYQVFDMGRRFGGPLIWIDKDEIYLGTRFFTEFKFQHVGIFKLDEKMMPNMVLILPSFGDCSYMGITKKIEQEGYIISYYSSHECLEGNSESQQLASIYVADIDYISSLNYLD